MIYAKVDSQDRETIQAEMRKTTDVKWYRRLKVVDLSGQGQTVPELAQMFDLSAATIRRYIHLYNDVGLAVLRPAYGRGRPPLLNWTQAQWQDVLAQSPANMAQLNTAAQNWTQATGIELSEPAFRALLKKQGYRYRRPKHDLGHLQDPEVKADADELLDRLKKRSAKTISHSSLWTKQP
jgi:transposase